MGLFRLSVVFGLLTCILVGAAANAATVKDVNVAIRVLDFVTPPIAKRNTLGILFDGQNMGSITDAQALAEWAGSGNGKQPWQVTLVDVRSLNEEASPGAVLLAAGLEPFYDQIYVWGKKSRVVIISFELGCVRAARCTVGVATQPRIEVILNQQVASAFGIEFSQGFRMMVTEY